MIVTVHLDLHLDCRFSSRNYFLNIKYKRKITNKSTTLLLKNSTQPKDTTFVRQCISLRVQSGLLLLYNHMTVCEESLISGPPLHPGYCRGGKRPDAAPCCLPSPAGRDPGGLLRVPQEAAGSLQLSGHQGLRRHTLLPRVAAHCRQVHPAQFPGGKKSRVALYFTRRSNAMKYKKRLYFTFNVSLSLVRKN